MWAALNGFGSNPLNPACRYRSISAWAQFDVIATTGTAHPCDRSVVHASTPSMGIITMSIITPTHSGASRTAATASWPLHATRTSYPARFSQRWASFRMVRSSSTTTTTGKHTPPGSRLESAPWMVTSMKSVLSSDNIFG